MTDATAALTCPKCGAAMRTYERNGITVDQCTGCRGVFLDRGELERLIDAENDYYRPKPGRVDVGPAPGGYAPGGYAPGYGPPDDTVGDRDDRYRGRYDGRRYDDRWDDDDDDRRGRGGFLGGLLDFD